MNNLYNTIKPVGKRIIVAIKSGAKESHIIKDENGNDVELYIDTSYSWDGRITNKTQGVLLTDYKNLKAGTNVLLHHNSIDEDNKLDIQPDIHTSIYAVDDMFLYFGIDGDELICVDGFMLAERVYEDDEVSPGGIILTEKKQRESLLKILAKPESIEDFEVGDIAIVYKKSDYEMTHNIGGRVQKIIRLKYSDCLGKYQD
jgi:co-chaperonin GroES (HSP10)